ncbi:MAG: peptidoglycan DD-metalloendopeptidase family protein [Gemmobacter sp.]|nr:peptidoglycan DD-metalloendopeptidase family protein [Gemmobacter sp.]
MAGAAVAALAACSGPGDGRFDWDLRQRGGGLSTTDAARQTTIDRPRPDGRGIISYPGYQVAVANRGDTVASVASRLGMSANDLGKQNAITPDTTLRAGEVLVLPGRIAEPAFGSGMVATGPITSAPVTGVDVGAIATTALDRADNPTRPAAPTPAPVAAQAPTAVQPAGLEPKRHKVERGETAYSIARLYNVTAKSVADWNGLGPDLYLRAGQTLLIPPAADVQPPRSASADAVTVPGAGSPTPLPPSAAKPLPAEKTAPASAATDKPASPDLGQQRTAVSSARFTMPTDGKIIRAYEKKKYDGIGIGAPAGTVVRAAADGTVAAITRDTEQVAIVVLRHDGNLLTVYANVDGIAVTKDAKVKRGQTIGKVGKGDPAFLHFEVRKGSDSVDPMTYLQ